MRTKIIFILCCVCYLYLTSCGKTHCPAFPEHLVDYFPYNKGDSLLFTNQHNDSVLFIISTIGKTQAHSFEKRCDCACDPPIFSFGASKLKQELGIEGTISLSGYPTKPHIIFTISNNYWDSDFVPFDSKLTFIEESGKDPFNPQNGALFGDTVIIEDNSQLVSRVTVIKGKGITEFYDQKYDLQWKIIHGK